MTPDELKAWDAFAAACLGVPDCGAEDAAKTADRLIAERRKRSGEAATPDAYAELLAAAEAVMEIARRDGDDSVAARRLDSAVRAVKEEA